MKNIKFFIPYNINNYILKNNNHYILYLHNNIFFFSIVCNSKIFINNNTNTVNFFNNKINNKSNLFNNDINKFLFSWDNLFFNKIKFSGKGFKFKKKNNNIFLYFNRAHKCFFIGKNIIIKRLSKNKIIILKNNLNHIIYDSSLIINIRKNNIFTKRGWRFSRQIILKKKGKTASN